MTARAHAAAFAVLFVAIGLAFFLLNGQHAYHPTDDGFILAYAWRVANGEVPYRDFLYVRTPLSPYLHVLELLAPEGWQIQAGRLGYYLALSLSGLLPAAWAALRLDLRATPRSLALSATCFVLALHNFPPMPWPTVDAVALSAIATTLFLFSCGATPGRTLALRAGASLLLALAVLAKQSFAFLALVYGAYALVDAIRARTFRPFAAAVLPGLLVGGVALALLAGAGALSQFVQQISQPAQLRPTADIPWSGDLASGGIEPYVSALSPIGLLFPLIGFALGWSRDATSWLRKAAAMAAVAGIVAIAIEMQFDVFASGRHLFFVLCGAGVAMLVRRRDARGRLTLAAFGAILALAWCASLSFAYQTPLLGLAAGGVLLEASWPRVEWRAERLAVALAFAISLAAVARLDLDRPYRDVPRADQTADLGTVYPRFGQLWTNPTNVERFAELRALSSRFALDAGRPFVVMPDYPLAYFLSGTRSPLSIDWIQPQEYVGNEQRLARDLDVQRPIVLIEREPSLVVDGSTIAPAPCDHPPATTVSPVREVAASWTIVAQGRYFCVYVHP